MFGTSLSPVSGEELGAVYRECVVGSNCAAKKSLVM